MVPEAGLEARRLFVGPHRVGELPARIVDVGEVRPGAGVGREADGLAVRGHGAVEVAQHLERGAQHLEGPGVVGLELRVLPVGGGRLPEPPGLEVDPADGVVVLAEPGAQREGTPRGVERRIGLSRIDEQVGELAQVVVGTGTNGERSSDLLDGLRDLSPTRVDDREAAAHLGIPWIEAQGLLHRVPRAVRPLRVARLLVADPVRAAECGVGAREARVGFESGLEVGGGARGVARPVHPVEQDERRRVLLPGRGAGRGARVDPGLLGRRDGHAQGVRDAARHPRLQVEELAKAPSNVPLQATTFPGLCTRLKLTRSCCSERWRTPSMR